MISIRSRSVTLPYMAYESPFGGKSASPPLKSILNREEQETAFRLFRRRMDTVDIAFEMECTQAAAANGIARARDREHAQ